MDNNEKAARSFLALDLPEEIKSTIHALYSTIKNESKIKIKWIIPDNLHLTIKFLGNIQENQMAGIINNLENISIERDINLCLDSYGVFPPSGIPRILWVSLKEKEEDCLSSLFKNVEKELEKSDFPKEKRKFSPHITIARLKLKNVLESEKFYQMLEIFKKNFNEAGKDFFTINKLNLFKSELTPAGAVYSIIREFHLRV